MTGSELLIEAMEKFSLAEPESALVVWVDEENVIHMLANCANHEIIGMGHYAIASCTRYLMNFESDHNDR